MGADRTQLRDVDTRLAGDAPPPARHFVFAPSDLPDRNRAFLYFASLGLIILGAVALQWVAGMALGIWAQTNAGARKLIEALVAKDLSKVPWDLFFGLVGVSFLTYILAIAFALRVVHARGLRSVLTDRNRFDWGRVAIGFFIYGALLVGPFLYYYWTTASPPQIHFETSAFLRLLLISAVVLIVQTSAEEIFFRGYLTQFVASFTTSPLFIIGIPSALFMLAHLENPELKDGAGVLAFYFGFGVFMSLVALRDRGLEFAIGAHFANNLVIATLIRTPDSVFQTPTLFVLPPSGVAEASAILPPLIAPLVYYFITFAFARRR
ncbi:MAG: CPBP family intramembrane glutamic endopeptidase [Alphaproteobacteria bacterium]